MHDDSSDNIYVPWGKQTIHFERKALTPEFIEIARKELRETEEIKREAIVKLRELIMADPLMFLPLDKDELLVQHLRPCKFYPESAYAKMKLFFAFKWKYRKLYEGLLPSNETTAFVQNLVSVLPNRDQHGRRIMLIQGGRKWKPSECSLNQLIRAVFLMVETAVFEAKTQIAGGILIMDLEGIPFNHVFQFTPSFAKMVVHYGQECMPIRMKAIHIINQNYIFNIIFSLFKPFLQEKVVKRMHFHGYDRESLLNHLDPKCVPTRYGGDMDLPDEIDGDGLCKALTRYDEDFKELMTYGYSSDDHR